MNVMCAIAHIIVIAAATATLPSSKTPAVCPSISPRKSSTELEVELVRQLTLREAEGCLDVLLQELRLLDSSDDSAVDCLLVRRLRLRERFLLLRLSLGEKLLLCGTAGLGCRLREVCVVNFLVDLDGLQSTPSE